MKKSLWQRIPLIPRSIVSGLLVTFSGLLPWSVLFGVNITLSPAIPWSVVVCGIYLFFWNGFMKGKVFQNANAPLRADRYRVNSESQTNSWIYVAGGMFSLGLFLMMIAAYYLRIPIQELPLKGIHPLVVVVYFAMASFVAGLCEEVGLRGYTQQPIEKKNGIVSAVTITTLLFVLLHLGNAEAMYLIPFYILIAINFGILAWRSQNLRPVIIFHTLTNFFSYLILWLSGSHFAEQGHTSFFTTLFIIGVAMVFLSLAWAYPKLFRLNKVVH